VREGIVVVTMDNPLSSPKVALVFLGPISFFHWFFPQLVKSQGILDYFGVVTPNLIEHLSISTLESLIVCGTLPLFVLFII
jgi:hypothetical protein